jgi:ubiquinol-cytochrome c reductase cytochrome b subunit
MRDVNMGWLVRYAHSNGASMFFVVVYIHVFRGLYYLSYLRPRGFLWGVGVVILFLMILTAFMGYVLPWGQMSFWGATVITNLVSAIPSIGTMVVVWLWGGYAVASATLNRFFSLHFFLPFVILVFVFLHFYFLHRDGSTNPLGVWFYVDRVPFFPYYYVKDFYGLLLFLIFFCYFVFFLPNILGHSDNYILANPIVTPPHIVPEWYFLPFYAVLRSIPDKLFGVLALLMSIGILFLLPIIGMRRCFLPKMYVYYKFLFWFFSFNWLLMLWLGSQSVESPYLEVSQLTTSSYFFYFILLYIVILIDEFFDRLWYFNFNAGVLASGFKVESYMKS